MIALWIFDTDSYGIIPRKLLNILEPREEEKARLLRPADQRRFLISRIALRQGLSEVVGGDPSSWRFIIGETGKVSLAHSYGLPFVEFSLSHSENALAIAISTSGPVGVDIEEVKRARLPELDEVFPEEQFSEREQSYLDRTPPKKRWSETLKLWTRKEAHSKLLGLGLNLDFSKLDVLPHPDQASEVEIETQEVSLGGKNYFLSLALRRKAPERIDIRSPDLLACVRG